MFFQKNNLSNVCVMHGGERTFPRARRFYSSVRGPCIRSYSLRLFNSTPFHKFSSPYMYNI